MSWLFINVGERGRINKLIYKGPIGELRDESTRDPDNKLSAIQVCSRFDQRIRYKL